MSIRIVAALLCAVIASTAAAEVIDISDAEAYPALYEPNDAGPGSDGRGLVLLGADMVEIAVALGAADRILARPIEIDLPGIEDTPHKVRQWAGVEGILALRPKLVVGSSIVSQRLLDGLEAVGVRTANIDRALSAVEKVRRLAALLDLEDRGAKLVEDIEADYTAAPTVDRDREPLRIVHASKMGAGTNFSAGGSATAVHNLILRVGALNAFAEIGRDRYRPVTPEGMILMAPDVVIISEKELPSFGDVNGLWHDYPGIGLTPAGRDGNIVIMRELHVRSDAASSGIATKALSNALAEMFR
ncbi:MAG: ABC transporter substrate-binding protein [Rhizobiaceae bacterium]|nr:ABC transporter substrate-binding protein [Rhizobiaceae bacterium]